MGVLRGSKVDKDGNLFKRYPMKVALKRGFAAQTYIVGRFNQKAQEPLMTKAYIEHLIERKKSNSQYVASLIIQLKIKDMDIHTMFVLLS